MKLRWLWWSLGALLLIAVLVVCLTPLRVPAAVLFYNDKLMHVLTFVMLTVWFGGLQRNQSLRGRVILLATLCAYGVLIEILQSQTAYRSAELADLLADLLGIVVGLGLLSVGLYRWPAWVERYVLRRHSK
jgi:VanZ family protein|tara:strand:- start:381 stop:773 length:393 start_codon:yes stop_codon:yes gene_type:complete